MLPLAVVAVTIPASAALNSADATLKKTTNADSLRSEALRLLDEAKLQAGVLEPASQAGLFFVIGEAYMAVDKKKARNALEIAYQNMRAAMGESPDIVGFMAQI